MWFEIVLKINPGMRRSSKEKRGANAQTHPVSPKHRGHLFAAVQKRQIQRRVAAVTGVSGAVWTASRRISKTMAESAQLTCRILRSRWLLFPAA